MINSKSYFSLMLIISLVVVSIIWTIPYLLGPNIATISSDLTYIPLTVILTITALFQVSQTYKKSKENLIWIIFAVFAISYNIAQHIWSVKELIFDQKPFPSLADVAFLIDTICLILFFILYIKSLKQNISKKMWAISILPSCGIVLFSIYNYTISNTTENIINQILLFSYPFLDSIALVFALIGIMLWFKNKLNFAVFLICISMIPLTIGDLLYQITTQNGIIYSGFIPDLFYYIQIDLLIFGVYYLANIITKNDFEEKKI
ncbi:MAG: hypothetical protein WA833_01705 [Nitrosotalea sp.]